MTTLAHSYGSVVAGAATHHDNPNDNLVVFGSPGTTVDHVSELDIPAGHVYKAFADMDNVLDFFGSLEPFGNQPASNSLSRRTGGVGSGCRQMLATGRKGPKGIHEYMNLGTESLMNMSRVVAEKYDDVTLVLDPNAAYDQHGNRVPNPQPGPPPWEP